MLFPKQPRHARNPILSVPVDGNALESPCRRALPSTLAVRPTSGAALIAVRAADGDAVVGQRAEPVLVTVTILFYMVKRILTLCAVVAAVYAQHPPVLLVSVDGLGRITCRGPVTTV